MSDKNRQLEFLRKDNTFYKQKIASLESQTQGLDLIVAQNETKTD